MASYRKKGRGYQITAYDGYDAAGKKKRYFDTYIPEDGIKPAELRRNLQAKCTELDRKVQSGKYLDGPCAKAEST